MNPLACKNPVVFTWLAQGRTVPVPNFGMELLHHVHADDVAQMFLRAMQCWSTAVGEAFFCVSPAAYAASLAGPPVGAAPFPPARQAGKAIEPPTLVTTGT